MEFQGPLACSGHWAQTDLGLPEVPSTGWGGFLGSGVELPEESPRYLKSLQKFQREGDGPFNSSHSCSPCPVLPLPISGRAALPLSLQSGSSWTPSPCFMSSLPLNGSCISHHELIAPPPQTPMKQNNKTRYLSSFSPALK